MIQNTPTQLQQRASDPKSSVWVAASAGSGKTKVLVDRVLRLLLQGVSPDNILCITYTTAAAAEMLERVTKKAREWTLLPEEELRAALLDLQGYDTNAGQMRTARSLFLMLADASPGLRVLTIHSFCQNMLNQFPVEAGIAPHFSVIDDAQQREFLSEAKTKLFKYVYHQHDDALNEAIDVLSDHFTEYRFDEMLEAIISNRRIYAPTVRSEAHFVKAQALLYDAAGIAPDVTAKTIADACFAYDDVAKARYKTAAQRLHDMATEANAPRAEQAIAFFSCDITPETIARYLAPPLTTNAGAIHSGFVAKPFQKAHPDDAELLERFTQQVAEYNQQLNILHYAHISHALLIVAYHFFQLYRDIKEQHHALDFDDLIMLCLSLLDNESMIDWVLYKLDGQIDHILIDEAQDTSKEQWQLTHALTGDFFAGQGAKPYARTVFVVGDEKQSIYRFQGAAPEAFADERTYYKQAAAQVMQTFEDVGMHTSFRSVQTVLSFVDAVFAEDDLHHAIASGDTPIKHTAFRADDAGQVVLHPAFIQEEKTSRAPWTLPHEVEMAESPLERCATQVADEVKGWLKAKRMVAGRSIQPGDILILVRKRGRLVDALSRELHKRGVPVAGNDRLSLHDHIAIKDMLALCRVLIDVHDDMSLAALMTSPFYNASYDQLTDICASRADGQSVWRALRTHSDALCADIIKDIETWREMSRQMPPYTLLCHILFASGGMDKFVSRMGEAVRDVLQNLLYKAESFSNDALNTLPNFVEHMEALEKSIKRDMEQGGNEVRIMTVHGSKGLEAPIVILPDTTSVPISRELIVPYEQDDATLMLYRPAATDRSGIFDKAVAHGKEAELHEYYRLLYVALTRARDELHCFGYLGKNAKNVHDDSWYAALQGAMQRSNAVCTPCDEAGRTGDHYVITGSKPLKIQMQQKDDDSVELPDHLKQEHFNVTLLQERRSPSALYEGEYKSSGAAWAPQGISPNEYGTLLHYFLELQCNTPFERFMEALPDYIRHVAGQYDAQIQHHIAAIFSRLNTETDIVSLLNAPAQAELQLIGLDKQMRYLNGAIDRLICNDNSVTIIDFKHGSLPKDGRAPEPYYQQMQAYKELVSAVFPQHLLRCKLVYIAPEPAIIEVL